MPGRHPYVVRRSGYRLELWVAFVLVGSGTLIVGLFEGVAPMLQRRAPCFYSLTPPADFAAEYHEGIAGTGPWLSIFPYGARCSYVASATGETTMSVLPPWPSVLVLAGVMLLVLGAVRTVRTYRNAR